MSRRPNASGGAVDREVRRAALLWGVVATLAFLVLVQGYHLLELGRLPLAAVAVAAPVVFAVTALLTYFVGP